MYMYTQAAKNIYKKYQQQKSIKYLLIKKNNLTCIFIHEIYVFEEWNEFKKY